MQLFYKLLIYTQTKRDKLLACPHKCDKKSLSSPSVPQLQTKMRHLTAGQRYQISVLLIADTKKCKIAEIIGVNKSTITRELQRNGYVDGCRYIPEEAQKRAQFRWDRRLLPGRLKDLSIQKRAWDYLVNEDLSPEQIVGRCLRKGKPMVSHETLYKWIWTNKRSGGTLYTHLRHKGRKYRSGGATNNSRKLIPNATDISERPAVVDERSRFGDFEIDTIVGKKHSQHMLTITERRTKLEIIRKLKNATAGEAARALIEALTPFAERGLLKTITADNGVQFKSHEIVTKALGVTVYFARPYHAWERGTNENSNGLIRQYIPKGSDFDEYTEKDVAAIQNKLNSRPRKRLDFMTPLEVLEQLTNYNYKT